MHISQPIVAALKFVGEFLMVDAQALQNCGVQVVNMDRVSHDVIAILVGLAV